MIINRKLIYRRFFWQTLVTFAILTIALSTSIYVLTFIFNRIELNLLVSTIIALGVGTYLAFRVARPLERLKARVEKVAIGELNEVVDLARNETVEIHEIAKLMDQIANQLLQRINIIQIQKDEQEAVLTSMEEGLIAVEKNHLISHLNPASARLFRVHRDQVIGKPIEEVVRIPELLEIVHSGLKNPIHAEKDIQLLGEQKKFLRVHTSPLRNQSGDHYGVVLVVSDVTRIRELEGMRKNFVTNVSHELRTPLTSIQGFAETLMNPEVKDPKEIRKFTEIIQRHANRLGRIIEDILTLSRIEKDAESSYIETKLESFDEVVEAAVELCEVKAKSKGIVINFDVKAGQKVNCDRYLIEQAIVNLVDNAVRYSDTGKAVEVRTGLSDGEVFVEVEDHGMGIANNHISRIFERFYRVDRARSRELGGTGLGLSIVKHIVLAHKGKIEVKSQIGQGTVFTVRLPLAKSTGPQ